jgi:hypothetical protein
MKATVGRSAVPCHWERGGVAANRSTYTPLGITTASPPRCSTRVRLASSDTAIRAEIFSRLGRSSGCAACMARERRFAVWKVATIGPCAAQRASRDSDGVTGSWMCRTSNEPSASQRRTRAALTGPNVSRATDPLYFTGTALPAAST